MKLPLLICALFITISASAQKRKPTKPDRFAGLDTTFARVLTDWKAVGFAVAVVEKGKVIYSKGFGYRDLEKKLPVTPNTLFAIGSCTKAFTSSLIGLLHKDGKVDYDEPVTKYLPSLKFFSDDLTNHITLRDMMCHRTGLPRHDLSWYLNPTSRDSLVGRLQYMEPSAPLRQRWQYNNFMFMAQGVVAEKLSGKSWESNVRERIFEPLGMSSSLFSVNDMAKSTDASFGYEVKKDSLIQKMAYYNIDAVGPAGSINSNVVDMAKWVSIWTNGGKFGGKEILPAAYVKEAMTSQMVISGGLPEKEIPDVYMANYGFGWMLASYKGHYRVEHGGNIDGFSASTCFFPSDSVGIIVLTNQNGSPVPSIVRNIITDRVLGLPAFDWNKDRLKLVNKAKASAKETEKKVVSTRKKGTKPSHRLADYAGTYGHEGYGNYAVTTTGDSLFLQTATQKYWLDHFHYDIFQPFDTKGGIDTTDKSPVRFQFTTGLMGDIDGIAVSGFESAIPKPLVFSRSAAVKGISAADLKKYVGEYDLAGVTASTSIKGEKTLMLLVPGQPEYELVFVGNHKFTIKKLVGFSIQFELNDKGETTALTAMQPNGTFKATKKVAAPVAEKKE
ncbi:serine hydrolase [Spirosoma sp. HMF3257]|uniref:Serine hydrolase n=1 Tax=Spirosoma telluris TaxID=2183553 RepID=A0A327NRC7_9BACT|nr:serine hydrolase [Spirosoma telluris]RAI76979.1 serine hydrolase [Spirosoma telluris]